MSSKTVRKSLKYYFTDKEKLKIGDDLGRAVADKEEIEADKKNVMNDFKLKIEKVGGKLALLSSHLRNGFELRGYDCPVDWDWDGDRKNILHPDTQEILESMPITSDERQMHLAAMAPADISEFEEDPGEPEPDEGSDLHVMYQVKLVDLDNGNEYDAMKVEHFKLYLNGVLESTGVTEEYATEEEARAAVNKLEGPVFILEENEELHNNCLITRITPTLEEVEEFCTDDREKPEAMDMGEDTFAFAPVFMIEHLFDGTMIYSSDFSQSARIVADSMQEKFVEYMTAELEKDPCTVCKETGNVPEDCDDEKCPRSPACHYSIKDMEGWFHVINNDTGQAIASVDTLDLAIKWIDEQLSQLDPAALGDEVADSCKACEEWKNVTTKGGACSETGCQDYDALVEYLAKQAASAPEGADEPKVEENGGEGATESEKIAPEAFGGGDSEGCKACRAGDIVTCDKTHCSYHKDFDHKGSASGSGVPGDEGEGAQEPDNLDDDPRNSEDDPIECIKCRKSGKSVDCVVSDCSNHNDYVDPSIAKGDPGVQ